MTNTFVRITNREIYEKLESIEEQVLRTNGKVKANTKMIYSIGGGVLVFAGWFVYHLINVIGG